MTVRPAREDDAQRIWEIHADSIRRLCAGDYSTPQIEAWVRYRTVEDYARALSAGETNWLATDAASILGYATYVDGELTALFVDPAHARRGVGRALLATAEHFARAQGRSHLTLQSTVTSQPFYERSGFTAGAREEFILPGGVGITCVRMTKRL